MKSLNEVRQELLRRKMVNSTAYAKWVLPIGHPEAQRMSRCGEMDAWNNFRRCNSPFCERCRRNMLKKDRAATLAFFDGFGNSELAQLTLLLPVLPAPGKPLDDTIRKTKNCLRNLFNRQRTRDPRWERVSLRGFWEVEPIKVSEWEALSPRKQRTLSDLGMPVVTGRDTLWLPHLHAIVSLGEISAADLRKALREVGYTGAFQVKVQPFYKDRDVKTNLFCTLKYHIKVDIHREGDGGDFGWWRRDEILALADWFGSKPRSGYEALRFSIYAKGARLRDTTPEHDNIETDSATLLSDRIPEAYHIEGDQTESGIRDNYIYRTTGIPTAINWGRDCCAHSSQLKQIGYSSTNSRSCYPVSPYHNGTGRKYNAKQNRSLQ